LLHTSVNSVDQLESLLLLRTYRESSFTAAQLGEKLYTSQPAAELTLAALMASGFVRDNLDGSFSYAAAPEVDELIDQLEKLYKTRRVTIISTIYNRP
jgi:hypothetical protein